MFYQTSSCIVHHRKARNWVSAANISHETETPQRHLQEEEVTVTTSQPQGLRAANFLDMNLRITAALSVP
jgi:hypothetical protein